MVTGRDEAEDLGWERVLLVTVSSSQHTEVSRERAARNSAKAASQFLVENWCGRPQAFLSLSLSLSLSFLSCLDTLSEDTAENSTRDTNSSEEITDVETEVTIGVVTAVVITKTSWKSIELGVVCLKADSRDEMEKKKKLN